MFKFFNRIKSIRIKLLIQFGFILSLSVLLMVLTVSTIQSIIRNTKILNTSHELNIIMLQMRRAEKDFMLREVVSESFFKEGKSNYLSRFDALHKLAIEKTMALEDAKIFSDNDSIELINEHLNGYAKTFYEMVDLYKKRGFKTTGLEGEMRIAIHAIEGGNFPYDTVTMLMLRRHEKDFLLRKDLADVEKFDKMMVRFENYFLLNPNPTVDLASLLKAYKEKLHQIKDAEIQLGLNEKEGVKGRLRTVVGKVEPMVDRILTKMKAQETYVIKKAYLILTGLFVIQLALGIMLSLYFANEITVAVKAIKERISKLSDGLFPEKITTSSVDETGVTADAVNNLIDRVRTAASFAEEIGKGNLNISYNKNFENDVLAKALQGMQSKLSDAAVENQRRSWVTTGLANFSEVLRSTDTNIHELSQKIISNLVQYLKANQGQLYIVQDENEEGDESLELMATYAWGRSRHAKNKIGKGEGLAGQCWLEKEVIYLKVIPKDYISITSGLGEALPKCVLIVPLKTNDSVFGIIEIGSFHFFENHEIEFAKKLGELLASTLSSVKINNQTKRLLQESQLQSENLKSQEEEVRQNMEELSATQEQMNRQKVELEDRIRELEAELSKFKR